MVLVLATVCHVRKKRKGENNKKQHTELNVAAAENGLKYNSAKCCKTNCLEQ